MERQGCAYARNRGDEGHIRLDGIHHVTCITADALRNLDFYTRVLGLRLVKKTVNQDNPNVYHLFYGDEHGSPGADITFFEMRDAQHGRAGAGMVHRVVWRVDSTEAVDFWTQRLQAEGVAQSGGSEQLRFTDPDGLAHEISPVDTDETPLTAEHPDIPSLFALQGFDGVRAYASTPATSRSFLETVLGFQATAEPGVWRIAGPTRSAFYAYDAPPPESPLRGAGTVHHVAFSTEGSDQDLWHERVAQSPADPSPSIDRFWFKSIYVREPSGVLFELATKGPGFTVDEPVDSLGERLTLPPSFEPMRKEIERGLTRLPDPRARR